MEQERYMALQKTSLITMIMNIIMTVAKIIIGVISGSTAVISDGIHTLSDCLSTVTVMAGLKLSNKGADDDHPYGHQRIESLVSLFLAVILAGTALMLGYSGVDNLLNGAQAEASLLAFVVTIMSIASKEWMYQYTIRIAKRFNSTSLRADAWHHRSDAVSSVAVLIGLIGIVLGFGFLDSVAAIFVCIIILKAAFDIAKQAVDQLIDHAADEADVKRIREITLKSEGVLDIDLLKTRLSNNVIFVELEIEVDPNLTVIMAHDIAKNVHDSIERELPSVRHCMVHVNPKGVEK